MSVNRAVNIIQIVWRQFGVCIFSASASVGALFCFAEGKMERIFEEDFRSALTEEQRIEQL